MAELFPEEAAKAQLEAEIRCAGREVKLRERVYARQVQAGQLTRATADREIALMQAIHDRLVGLRW